MRFDFLLCSERSGSNLITKIIDGHPEACGPFPSHMMRTFCPRYYLYGSMRDEAHWRELTEDVAEYLGCIFAQWESAVTAAELRAQCLERTLAQIIRCVYEKEARARGKRRVFVKENHAWAFVPFTLASFPESRFVWLVRDPRDMALCQRDSILAGGVQTAARAWQEDQARSLEVYGYLKDSGRMALFRFEDLAAHAEDTVRRLCEFIELSYHPAMLEFYRDPNVVRNAAAIRAWSDLSGPIIADNFGAYRTGLSEAEIRFVEAYCRDEMLALGYEFEFDGAGDVHELRAALPEESSFTVERDQIEKQRYTPFQQVQARLRQRWEQRRVKVL